MSSRYALFDTGSLRDRFALASGVPKGVKPHYNISPVQTVPVVVSRDGKNEMELMKWGFIPNGAPNANSVFRYKTFNARSEGIFDKPTWQTAIRSSRCLIPANGFYEWKKTADKKQPFYIHPTDQSTFAFAGLYSTWTDPEGNEWGTCSIVTTNSGAESDMTQVACLSSFIQTTKPIGLIQKSAISTRSTRLCARTIPTCLKLSKSAMTSTQ